MKAMKWISAVCWFVSFVIILLSLLGSFKIGIRLGLYDMFGEAKMSFVGIGLSLVGLVLAILVKSKKKKSNEAITKLDGYNFKNNIVTLFFSVLLALIFYFDIFSNLLN